MWRLLKFAVLAVGVVWGISVVSRWTWHRAVDGLLHTLASQPPPPTPGRTPELPPPPPVARYLAAAIPAGRPDIVTVDLDTAGTFQMGHGDDGWRAFHARQRFNTSAPGFVWDARIQMAPMVPVFVRDAYIAGHGTMVARVLANYAVANEADTPELAEGELMRYLAEMIWFPTALRPEAGVTWSAVDARAALATFSDHGHTVSLRFTFDDAGRVIEVYAADRLRAMNGGYVPMPWSVRCWDHETHFGVTIPMASEAVWLTPSGPEPYWRGRVTNIRYDR
jgi:hypothetical protein